MLTRLEKINPGRRQKRFYLLQVTQTLFGEWCLIREWGRIGMAGGQSNEVCEPSVSSTFRVSTHLGGCQLGAFAAACRSYMGSMNYHRVHAVTN